MLQLAHDLQRHDWIIKFKDTGHVTAKMGTPHYPKYYAIVVVVDANQYKIPARSVVQHSQWTATVVTSTNLRNRRLYIAVCSFSTCEFYVLFSNVTILYRRLFMSFIQSESVSVK